VQFSYAKHNLAAPRGNFAAPSGALGFLFTLCINGRGEVDFDRVFGQFGAFSDRFTGVFAYTMHAYSLPHSPQQSIALCCKNPKPLGAQGVWERLTRILTAYSDGE